MTTATATRRQNILLGGGLAAFSLGAVFSQLVPDISDPLFFFVLGPIAARALAAGDQWGYLLWSGVAWYVAPSATWLAVLAVALWKGPTAKKEFQFAIAIVGASIGAGIIFLLATGRWQL